MTTTILAAIALSGSLAPAAKPEFQTDYAQAMKRAADEKKPMAVLIGKGDAFAKLMDDSGMSDEAKKLLAEKYVCVSVDVTTDGGKTLAGQFQLTDGLVISSAGGSYQALRQSGAVTATDLSKHTVAYANVSTTPATTMTTGTPVITTTSGYTPSTMYPAGYAPSYAPTYYAPTYSGCSGGNCGSVYPTRGYSFPSTYGGGCSNGRCSTYSR